MIIHFSDDEIEDFVSGAWKRNPLDSETIRIRIEDADCDGISCGERPELVLPPDDYEQWKRVNGERAPLGRHSHMLIIGTNPRAKYLCAVLRKT